MAVKANSIVYAYIRQLESYIYLRESFNYWIACQPPLDETQMWVTWKAL